MFRHRLYDQFGRDREEIGKAIESSGGHLIDAPVTGGVEGAKDGTLTVLVGGEPSVVSRCHPVLDAVGQKIVHVGALGAGSICKVLHNCAVFSSNLAMVECLTTGVKAGIDPNVLVRVFQESGIGRNVALPARLLRGVFEPRYTMATAHKDMMLAVSEADRCGVPLRLADLCREDMDEAMERGWGDQDHTIFLTLQEERAGAQVRIQSE